MRKVTYILLFLLLSGISQAVFAFDKRVLSDTLTHYANEQAKVGKVNISRVQVRNNEVTAYDDKKLRTLSMLPMTPKQADKIRRIVSQFVLGHEDGKVLVFSDGYELSELIPQRFHEDNAEALHFTLPPVKHPLVVEKNRIWKAGKGLDGIHIALYGSHGLYFNQPTERWIFQRAKLLTTVEDLYTSSFTMPFLVPMLENAGAIVLQPRERDTQTEEWIVDDVDVTLTGGWKTMNANGWGHSEQPLTEGKNPFTFGGYAKSEAQLSHDNAKQLVYEPQIQKEGDYAVYVSYRSLNNSAQQAEYEVVHSGLHTTFVVNQKMGGGTWIYLGTFHFTANDKERNRVLVSNYGKKGEIITSDAIRFGGGMGSVARYKTPEDNSDESAPVALISGYPRYMEGARYWLQYAGIPDTVYNYSKSKNDYLDDLSARGKWVNWLSGGSAANPDKGGLNIPIHAGLAFHSDAGNTGNDSIIGTLTIYTDKNNEKKNTYPNEVSRLSARSYADYIQTQIVNDVQKLYAPEWKRRELKNASYSESRNPEIPMIILELLSHQNLADMRYGHDPRFKFNASRAIYKGMLKYLHEQYGTDYIVQPLPIRNFAVNFHGEDALRLTWEETNDALEKTAKPGYYIVYIRKAGSDWDKGTMVQKKEYIFHPDKDIHYDFRVVAGNKGGISMPSETLSAGISSASKGSILIVNGFTRICAPESFAFDSIAGFVPASLGIPYGKDISYIGAQYNFNRNSKWVSDDNCGFGASYMDYSNISIAGNTFDYPTMHGKLLIKQHFSYVSSSLGALGDSISQNFTMVDVILGKQKETVWGLTKKTVDFKVIPPTLQQTLRRFAENGGNLLLSGAYITSDMQNTAEEKKFTEDILHCRAASVNATRNGKVQILRSLPASTLQLNTTPNQDIICCENPDGIEPIGDNAVCIARYKDTAIGAGVGSNGNNKSIVFAFPLESCEEFENIYTHCINWLTK